MTIYVVQKYDGKHWRTVERFKDRAAADAKAAAIGGRVVEAWRSSISI